ncbi:hypothetical protein BXP70_27225 [Hymenobacter crusticola]|uniref:Uncharacterized protein n=1 Tax=Hymenobacter crusticola TaxID=1770526 RepID=A0A243W621_9BACT|nr:hypothetical protein BXP70_27225 [Hymenobacter crusticola]
MALKSLLYYSLPNRLPALAEVAIVAAKRNRWRVTPITLGRVGARARAADAERKLVSVHRVEWLNLRLQQATNQDSVLLATGAACEFSLIYIQWKTKIRIICC